MSGDYRKTVAAGVAGVFALGAVLVAVLHIALHDHPLTSEERNAIGIFVGGALLLLIPGLAKWVADRFPQVSFRKPKE